LRAASVPGTGTALQDFYNDPAIVQQICNWRAENAGVEGVVSFA
jgi:hypothetical protein